MHGLAGFVDGFVSLDEHDVALFDLDSGFICEGAALDLEVIFAIGNIRDVEHHRTAAIDDLLSARHFFAIF